MTDITLVILEKNIKVIIEKLVGQGNHQNKVQNLINSFLKVEGLHFGTFQNGMSVI